MINFPATTGQPTDGSFTHSDSGITWSWNGVSWDTSGGGSLPSGTRLAFQQSVAPTGWVQDTTYNDYALRIVNGAAGTGGSVGFSAAFASGLSTGSHTLTVAQMPSHSHGVNDPGHTHEIPHEPVLVSGQDNAIGSVAPSANNYRTGSSGTGIYLSAEGGGGGHSHAMPGLAVKYVDFIIAVKS